MQLARLVLECGCGNPACTQEFVMCDKAFDVDSKTVNLDACADCDHEDMCEGSDDDRTLPLYDQVPSWMECRCE